MMPKITRPLKGKVRVSMPFRAGSANFTILRDLCGPGTQIQYNRATREFEVAPIHFSTLVAGLPRALDRAIEVVQQGAIQIKCVATCWSANPDTVYSCKCSCAGSNHGTSRPFSLTAALDLSIQTDYTESVRIVLP